MEKLACRENIYKKRLRLEKTVVNNENATLQTLHSKRMYVSRPMLLEKKGDRKRKKTPFMQNTTYPNIVKVVLVVSISARRRTPSSGPMLLSLRLGERGGER